ncbi:hypothetical protein BCR34DRAFT_607050 [Clohesyomyces aquaticus]|uniref:Uncharacterized protein n=1 Tax=Clohesyomyces aquaticus TaxID=1231657 RepID=A0A1Y1YJ59_9PLEO|nr:hypothetical protein BCR34DRAFT_607050 [Clohesyomyces aquaticus]
MKKVSTGIKRCVEPYRPEDEVIRTSIDPTRHPAFRDLVNPRAPLIDGLKRSPPSNVTGSIEISTAFENGDSPPAPVVYLEIGQRRQHVGTYYGRQLYDRVRNHLDWACPRVSGSPCDKTKIYKVPNIAFSGKDDRIMYTAWLELTVTDHNFPESWWYIREAMEETVANTFDIATSDSRNCYWKDLKDQNEKPVEKQWWCNAPEYVQAGITSVRPNKKGKMTTWHDAWLKVNLKFNGKTTEGNFDCPAVVQASRESLAKWIEMYDNSLMSTWDVNNAGPLGQHVCCPENSGGYSNDLCLKTGE